jgi:glycosyltransferase involved in cell wall biosynthesis
LEKCLLSIEQQTLDLNKYEVIVVDNNSTDDTPLVADSFIKRNPNYRIVTEFDQGLSFARNRGWKEAKGEYVVYIDDDAQCVPYLLEKVLDAFEKVKPKPVSVGGTYYPVYEVPPPKWFSDRFEIRSWGDKPGFLTPPRAKYGFSGGNMAFQRRVFDEYGEFPTDQGMVGGKTRMGEETALYLKIYQKEPYFWYDPNIRIMHWTPKRNLTFKYRYERAYKMGVSLAAIEGKSPFIRTFWERLAAFVLGVIALPFFYFSGDKRRAFVWIRKVGFSLGYFFG